MFWALTNPWNWKLLLFCQPFSYWSRRQCTEVAIPGGLDTTLSSDSDLQCGFKQVTSPFWACGRALPSWQKSQIRFIHLLSKKY